MCGLIPDLPLMTLLRVRRLTPRTFAPSVTDNPKGSRQAVLNAASGVRRVFHGQDVSPPLLVVVDQFNIECVRALKAENNTPVRPHRDSPEAFQLAFERVQPITGKVKRLRHIRFVETSKNVLNDIQQIWAYPAPVVAFIESFQTPVLEAPNQGTT